jgi:hypothetical protein
MCPTRLVVEDQAGIAVDDRRPVREPEHTRLPPQSDEADAVREPAQQPDPATATAPPRPLNARPLLSRAADVRPLDMSKPGEEIVITSTREEQVSPSSDTAGLRPQLFASACASSMFVRARPSSRAREPLPAPTERRVRSGETSA